MDTLKCIKTRRSYRKFLDKPVEEEKIKEIMNAFGFDIRDTLSLHVNLPVVEEDCCKTAFLRVLSHCRLLPDCRLALDCSGVCLGYWAAFFANFVVTRSS